MTPEAITLFFAAADDRSTLLLPVPERVFGFHAQQAVEKLLKALISANGQVFAWTHDLASLLKSVISLGEQLPEVPFPFLSLQPYATTFRYAEDPGLDEDTRKLILEAVEILFRHVRERPDALKAMPPEG